MELFDQHLQGMALDQQSYELGENEYGYDSFLGLQDMGTQYPDYQTQADSGLQAHLNDTQPMAMMNTDSGNLLSGVFGPNYSHATRLPDASLTTFHAESA